MKDIKENSKISIEQIIKQYSNPKLEVKVETAKPWTGFKELELVDRVEECEDIVSFYFKGENGEKLVKHKAGQFLPFKIKTDDEKFKDVIRTYSLSMRPNNDIYRISVKRVMGGLISNYLHDNLKIGDKIEAMMPAGIFTLNNESSKKPLVLFSAGIGITPLISMLYDNLGKDREIIFIQAVQNSRMQPFNEDIQKIKELNNLKTYVFFDRPLDEDVEGKDYDFKGFITKEWIEEYIPLNGDYYFCGPPPFMKNLNKSLLALGIEKSNINYEFFGDPQSME